MELYRKFRPKKTSDVVGQPEAVLTIEKWFTKDKVPHAIMLTGPSGCGKTTLARIIANQITDDVGITLVNCPSLEKPTKAMRDIMGEMPYRTLTNTSKVWIMDEYQSLSRAGFSQQACLEMFEDMPDHCYFILCTTDPGKISTAVKSRCTILRINALKPDEIKQVIQRICKKASIKRYSDEITEKIVELSEGSARKAVVLMEKIDGLKSDAERLTVLNVSEEAAEQAINLCRLLMKNALWKEVAQCLIAIEGENADGIRRLVLNYMRKVLLNSGKQRAYQIIQAFCDNVYDSDHAGLTAMAFAISRK